jgi:hypothetical protein
LYETQRRTSTASKGNSIPCQLFLAPLGGSKIEFKIIIMQGKLQKHDFGETNLSFIYKFSNNEILCFSELYLKEPNTLLKTCSCFEKIQNQAGGEVQVIESLPNKHETLSSDPRTEKKSTESCTVELNW